MGEGSDHMSEDENVVSLFPNLTNAEAHDNADEILRQSRDQMLEFLDGIRGRIMAFDIRGIACVAIAKDEDQDITFHSDHCQYKMSRTLGGIDFLKHDLVDDRLRGLKDYDDE